MKPSPYQEAVYRSVLTTNSNIVIKATAGSGKTSTLVGVSKILPYSSKKIFVAFSKFLAEELKTKLPGMECSTMHSIGYKALINHFGDVKMNDKLQIKFIEPLYEKLTGRKKWKNVYEVDQLLRLVRATMTPFKNQDIVRLAENHNLLPDESVIKNCIKAGKSLIAYQKNERFGITIDFQSMIEMPALNEDIKLPQYDFVMVDEIQDCSHLDFMFLNKLLKKPRGRLISVGDQNQAIYGFRGADPNSMDKFVNMPNTVSLPLSISYRVPKSGVKEAKKIYENIEEFSENIEGVVREGEIDEIQEGDFVLCRNLRPLMFVFLELINNGKKAHIVGKDLEQGLLAMISEYNSEEKCIDVISELRNNLLNCVELLQEKGIKNPTKHPKYLQLEEKVGVLRLILGKFEYVKHAEEFIEDVFHDDDDSEGVRLMTIHKSKGMENDRVFVIETFESKALIPSQYAVSPEQLKSEKNLLFVSRTRHKEELIYLNL